MSSFPLPPISTLSSVLDADDSPLAIAPELMGEEGAPPVRNNEQHPKDVLNHNNANSHSLPGHESLDPHESEYLDDTRQRVDSWSESAGFNARMGNAVDDQDGNLQPWGMYPDDSKPSNTTFGDHPPLSQPDLNSQRGQNHLDVPADQSNDDGLGQPSTSTENPRPKKRSRTNTKRASLPNPEITDPSGLDDTQLAEAEYEDPSRDWRLGPVFVQPPKGTAQACVRCHRIKRKCDGGRPRCAGCAKADVACVFELSPATSSWVQTLKDSNITLAAQLHAAHERLAQLDTIVGPMSLDSKGYDADGAAEALFAQAAAEHNQYGRQAEEGGPSEQTNGDVRARAEFADLARTVLSLGQSGQQQATNHTPLPPHSTARSCVTAYFDTWAMVYPFLDKAETFHLLDQLYGRTEKGSDFGEREFTCLMVIALGGIDQEGSSGVEEGFDKAIWARATRCLTAAIATEGVTAIQSLILLAVYVLAAPTPPTLPVTHVVALAVSLAVSMNLHRKTAHPPTDQAGMRVLETKKRIWWSLYILERGLAVSGGRPVNIRDEDVDVDLPNANSGEPAYRSTVALARIYGDIQTTLYSPANSQNTLSESDRDDLGINIHTKLNQWLNDCESSVSNESFMRKDWAGMRYHQALCLLYRPNSLHRTTSPSRLRKLYDASSSALRILALTSAASLPFDGFEHSRKFLTAISLLYSLCEYDNAQSYSTLGFNAETWIDEVRTKVEQCRAILAGNSSGGRYGELFERLSGVLLARIGRGGAESKVGVASRNGGSGARDQGENEAWNVMRRLWAEPSGMLGDARGIDGQGVFAFDVGLLGERR